MLYVITVKKIKEASIAAARCRQRPLKALGVHHTDKGFWKAIVSVEAGGQRKQLEVKQSQCNSVEIKDNLQTLVTGFI